MWGEEVPPSVCAQCPLLLLKFNFMQPCSHDKSNNAQSLCIQLVCLISESPLMSPSVISFKTEDSQSMYLADYSHSSRLLIIFKMCIFQFHYIICGKGEGERTTHRIYNAN